MALKKRKEKEEYAVKKPAGKHRETTADNDVTRRRKSGTSPGRTLSSRPVDYSVGDLSDFTPEGVVQSTDGDSTTPDREVNLTPLAENSTGFGEFYNDEWDIDQDVNVDILHARDPSPTARPEKLDGKGTALKQQKSTRDKHRAPHTSGSVHEHPGSRSAGRKRKKK